jgi:hypothetical protein
MIDQCINFNKLLDVYPNFIDNCEADPAPNYSTSCIPICQAVPESLILYSILSTSQVVANLFEHAPLSHNQLPGFTGNRGKSIIRTVLNFRDGLNFTKIPLY